jgi:hypothetical protein
MEQQSTALATYDPANAFTGLGIFEGDPIKPSKMDLIQPIMTEDEEGLISGRFRDTQSNMQFESLDIAVLEIRNSRVCYPPGSDRGAKPLCRSIDGLLPVINDELVDQSGGQGCGKCPNSKWKKINGRKIKPPCLETKQFLFAEVGTEFTYRMSAKGTANPVLTDLRETIRKMCIMSRATGFVPPFALTFKMTSTKVKGPKGTWYIPKFTPIGVVSKEQLPRFQKMYEYFVLGRGKNVNFEEEETTDPVSNVMDGEYVDQAERTYEAA